MTGLLARKIARPLRFRKGQVADAARAEVL